MISTVRNFFRSSEWSGNTETWLAITLTVLIAPIMLYCLVLYPSRRSAPSEGIDGRSLSRVSYFSSQDGRDLKACRKAIDGCDGKDELVTEIVMVSNLRDLKRTRFLRALYGTAASYALYFTALMLGTMINP